MRFGAVEHGVAARVQASGTRRASSVLADGRGCGASRAAGAGPRANGLPDAGVGSRPGGAPHRAVRRRHRVRPGRPRGSRAGAAAGGILTRARPRRAVRTRSRWCAPARPATARRAASRTASPRTSTTSRPRSTASRPTRPPTSTSTSSSATASSPACRASRGGRRDPAPDVPRLLRAPRAVPRLAARRRGAGHRLARGGGSATARPPLERLAGEEPEDERPLPTTARAALWGAVCARRSAST